MVPLARRNLLDEKGRFAMSVGGVAFAVLLILIVLSLYRGWGEVGTVYSELPGDVWVTERATPDPFHSNSFLRSDAVDTLLRVSGVRDVIPVYARHIAFRRGGSDLDIFGLALDLPPGMAVPRHLKARFVPPRGRIVIDRVLAGAAGVSTGDEIALMDGRLVVSRVTTGGNRIFETAFMNAADARSLFGHPGWVNFFLLSTVPGASVAEVRHRVEAALPDVETHTSEQFAARFGRQVSEGFLAAVAVLVAVGVLVGGAVIALTIYTATTERAREFGVLKAIGASGGFVYRVVIEQSLIVAVLGIALGTAAASVMASLVEKRVPEFVTELRPLDVAIVAGLSVVTAVVASFVPVRRIDRIDPATVFRA
ncbi:MAG: ABC transporter permease [Gaiellaceae bacterium]